MGYRAHSHMGQMHQSCTRPGHPEGGGRDIPEGGLEAASWGSAYPPKVHVWGNGFQQMSVVTVAHAVCLPSLECSHVSLPASPSRTTQGCTL